MEDWVTIKTYKFRPPAELDKSVLESQEIPSVIASDDAGGMRPFPFSFQYGIWLKVPKSSVTKAKQILSIS
jgi:hypothetical protein